MRKPRSRKARAAAMLAPLEADYGAPLLRQHAELVLETVPDDPPAPPAGAAPRSAPAPQAPARRARVRHECRLDWYWDRMLIEERQHQAGLRFRSQWLLATAERHMIASYTIRAPGRAEFTEARLAARARLARALTFLTRPEAAVVISVCGLDEWAAGALPALRTALTTLADLWGLPK
jgi:hypothetical protein